MSDVRGRWRATLGLHPDAQVNNRGAELRANVFAYNMIAVSVGVVVLLRDLATGLVVP